MSKGLYWTLIIIGDIALLASVFVFFNGGEFKDYFWGAFCGVSLIVAATMAVRKKKEDESK